MISSKIKKVEMYTSTKIFVSLKFLEKVKEDNFNKLIQQNLNRKINPIIASSKIKIKN